MFEKIAFTMYSVADVARARNFYENTLGLKVGMHGSHGDMHWVEYDLPGGGCLALTNTTGQPPGGGGIIGGPSWVQTMQRSCAGRVS